MSISYHNPIHSSSNEKCIRQIYRETRNTHFVFNNSFPKIGSRYNVEKYCRAEQTTEALMTHMHFTLDTYGYKHTLRIYKKFCFFVATMGTETRLNVTLSVVHCLSFISDAQSILHADAIKC